MKKIVSVLVSFVFVLTCGATALAAGYAAPFDAPDPNSSSRLQHVAALSQAADTCAEIISPMGGGTKTLSVPLVMQISSYYCGPASVNMTLSYFGVSSTQSQLAKDMGTTSSGTYVYQVRNCLNSHLGSGAYEYVLTSEILFGDGLMSGINAGKPVICDVQTGTLPIYNGHQSKYYLVATGYYWAQGGSGGGTDVVCYNDPNSNPQYYGQHSRSWTDMNTEISNNAGYYIMGS